MIENFSERSDSEIGSNNRIDNESESTIESESGNENSSLTTCGHEGAAVMAVDDAPKTVCGRTKEVTVKYAKSI